MPGKSVPGDPARGEPVLRRSQLTGTWRLSDVTAARPDGSAAQPLGRDPLGLLNYTGDGWMSAVIVPEEASGVPPICYAGRAEPPIRGSVLHVIEAGVPPFTAGTVQSRQARLDPAGCLLLIAPAGIAAAGDTTFRWTRVPADEHTPAGTGARPGEPEERDTP